MTAPAPPTVSRRLRLAGPLAIAAIGSTVVLAALAVAVLARAELRVRDALEQERALGFALNQSVNASAAQAAQNSAWNACVLAGISGERRSLLRARSELATTTEELSERLDDLIAMGTAAELPTEGASRAFASAARIRELLADAIADARQPDAGRLSTAEGEIAPAMEQARFELSSVLHEWSSTASFRRAAAVEQAAGSARRMKAWFEILSLATVGLVVALGAIAVRRDRRDVHT